MIKIVTHNAKFHADDVFAVATLFLALGKENCEVIRTRDENLIAQADYVVDVGNIYDVEKNRFDHHQKGGAGNRENSIPYSSFGLVWKKFGEKISGSKVVMERIDRTLVQSIDAGDNGVDLFSTLIPDASPYLIHGVVDQYRLTWKESEDWDSRFLQCVEWAGNFLKRMIKVQQDVLEGEGIVLKFYADSPDKRLIIFDDKHSLGRELVNGVLARLPEPIYAIHFRNDHKSWQLLAIRKDPETFDTRKPLPEIWRAKRDDELELATGVKEVTFCHRSGFMCVAKSKEAALALANLALKN